MQRFKNILCVIETDGECFPALERAVTLAENNQANLTVVAVSENASESFVLQTDKPIATELQEAVASSQQQDLESLLKPYRKRVKMRTKTLNGVPFLEIVREVLRNEYDLVIKIPEKQDWLDRLFGSNDMHLLRKCPCPVWLIKPTAPKSYRCVLAAVDINETSPEIETKTSQALSQQILEIASSLALSDFAELHIVHTWEAIAENALRGARANTTEVQIENYIKHVKQQHESGLNSLVRDATSSLSKESLNYLKPQKHLVKGSARKEIPAVAKRINADLVVMGTVARTGIPGFIMGNTAETVLNQLDCSVLAIKPPGFVTPVTLES